MISHMGAKMQMMVRNNVCAGGGVGEASPLGGKDVQNRMLENGKRH